NRSNKPVDLPRQRNVEGEVGPTNPPPSEQSSGSHVGDATYTSQKKLPMVSQEMHLADKVCRKRDTLLSMPKILILISATRN
ncbi:unnamed protein product, partial [Timema podura]|nr:unnamed protein product [Timema podura]